MIRALQAIVFDFDGVISDSEALHLRAYQDVLAPLGLSLSTEEYYQQYVGYHDMGVVERYAENRQLRWGVDDMSHLVDEKSRRYEELSVRGEMIFPGAAAFIRNAAAVVPIGIASGARTQEIEDILGRADLMHHFTAIVGADRVERSKPAPDAYLEAFAILSATAKSPLERDKTVAIEDSYWGLESARAAGLRLVAVANTYSADNIGPAAEIVVSGLESLTLSALDTLCAEPTRADRSIRRVRP